MYLTVPNLEILQTAGQSVDTARAAFVQSAQELNERIAASMSHDPFNLENDGLFETWKQVARIGRDLQHMDSVLRGLYDTATQLAKPTSAKLEAQMLRLLPPASTSHVVTDVEPKNSESIAPDQVARSRVGRRPKNATVLAKYLRKHLSKKTPTRMTLAEMGIGAGLSDGSVHAALKELLTTGVVIHDKMLGYTIG